ncbi:rRNA maturation RNase YbeY [Mesomycoplasma neurolyticum]|uniref:Endoribonuclease YbeY n=1 Tax=Mesomycoplasma neurolyticum TaxID=2120 RepID=A0A449A4T5_9BACT|nr:rRNA maturation RNase YbeY [Mesomycoplasma neurolyticum]VEU59232.1 putative metal binding protein [Mesomycoplasma neurolyticum]
MNIKKNSLNFLNDTKYKFEFLNEFKKIVDYAQEEFEIEKPLHVDLLLTNNLKIKKISNEYRKKDKETDVLSFPTDWNDFKFLDYLFLGEIIISYEKIIEQAKEYGHSIKREFCYLFTHGMVHLFHFDHQTEKDEEIMNSHVNNIMKKLGVNRDDN